jgi:uncharacterized glyoxalase superfamily protein PhnB
MSTVPVIPAGHHTVTSYLTFKNAAKALEFYNGRSERPRLANSYFLTDASDMRKSASAIP